MPQRFAACLVPVLLFVAASQAQATTYYLAGTGSDDGAGTQEAPWRTLQHAADEVAAGDTVLVGPGDYAGMDMETSGTEAEPIVFRAESGAMVTGDNRRTPDGINLEGAAWVTIEGFNVSGATRAGIRAVLGEHVTVRGNRVDDNGRWGILTGFSDDILVENNNVSRSHAEHGVYISNTCERPVVRGNILWNNAAIGLHMNGDMNAGGIGIISDALVENNVVFGNGELGGAGINCDGVIDSVIRNNLIYDNTSAGISLYRIDGATASSGNLVINNTIVMPDGSRWGIHIADDAVNTVLRNNIVLHENSVRGAIEVCDGCLAGLVSDHNAVTPRFAIGEEIITLAEWQAQTGQDLDALVGDASYFVDRAGDDYRLAAGSPAIDAGSATDAPGQDLAGNGRPQGAAVDLGAFEDCGDSDCEPPVCIGDQCTSGDDGMDGSGGGGCCQSGGSPTGGAALALLIFAGTVSRRRRSSP